MKYFRLALVALLVSCSGLSAADKAVIARDAAAIAQCQAETRICKAVDAGPVACWKVYDDCMKKQGLK